MSTETNPVGVTQGKRIHLAIDELSPVQLRAEAERLRAQVEAVRALKSQTYTLDRDTEQLWPVVDWDLVTDALGDTAHWPALGDTPK